MERGGGGAADPDDQCREVMIRLFPDVAESAARAVRQRELVIAVEGVADRLAPVEADIVVDVLAERVGEIHLACEHVLVVDEDLEMNMRGAAAIPAGIEAAELDFAARVGHLRSAHEGGPGGIDPVIVALSGIAG